MFSQEKGILVIYWTLKELLMLTKFLVSNLYKTICCGGTGSVAKT